MSSLSDRRRSPEDELDSARKLLANLLDPRVSNAGLRYVARITQLAYQIGEINARLALVTQPSDQEEIESTYQVIPEEEESTPHITH